jgi:hypothetical protein
VRVGVFPVEAYKCIICDGPVDENLIVKVFINPPDQSSEKGEGTPYLLNIAPCCGERACVEAAWEQVKKSTIGDIELDGEAEIEEDDTQGVDV